MKNLKRDSRTRLSFLIMISVNVFCCQETVFIIMSTWMIGESLMKQHYLKNKKFLVT